MRVCIVYNQHPTGCSYYRLEMPSSRVHEMFGSEAEFVSIADVRTMSDEELRTIDLFLYNRTWIAGPIEAVKPVADILRQYGAKIILDMYDYRDWETDRKSTRLNSSHSAKSRMPSSA